MGCGSSTPQPPKTLTNAEIEQLRHKKGPLTEAERAILKERELGKRREAQLYAQKDILRKRALPMIETRASCENLEMLVEQSNAVAAQSAASIIQKQARRKQAKKQAEAEQRWMVFSSMETISEADMLRLARFMETAITKVPELSLSNFQESIDALNSEVKQPQSSDDSDGSISLMRSNSKDFMAIISSLPNLEDPSARRKCSEDQIVVAKKVSSRNQICVPRESSGNLKSLTEDNMSVFRLDRISIDSQIEKSVYDLAPSDLRNFDLPPGFITPVVAEQVFNVYQKGGSLSLNSVHKLLRLAYRQLKALLNTTRVVVGPSDKLTVVGDIHGQLPDLLHIIEDSGFPSGNKKYIFNGDFVDRGNCGVEVMCILLTLFVAFPDSVTLNRGNHEDFVICCVYGFQQECCSKYNDVTFGMFVEVFHYLPLFAIINDSVLVLHGGLFHCQDVTLDELNRINRSDFSLKDIQDGEEDAGFIPRENEKDFLKQLQRDALWSDPMDSSGIAANPRGAGVAFGPDVTRAFLEKNKLKMIVRSHECVRTGFDTPFTGDDSQLLCTIFSASNYSDGGNSAAYMVFSTKVLPDTRGSAPTVVIGTNLMYSVYFFDAQLLVSEEDDSKTVVGGEPSRGSLSLFDLILAHKNQLATEFRIADSAGTGRVSKVVWAEIMQRVLKVHIMWMSMIPILVLDKCLSVDSVTGQANILYADFLQSFLPSMAIESTDEEQGGDDDSSSLDATVIEALYANHRKLEMVFRFFDKTNSGTISRENFREGCSLLNEMLPEDSKITDFDKIIDIMDINQSGEIDVNEFFEMFRLSDAHLKSLAHSKPLVSDAQASSSFPISTPSSSDHPLAVNHISISAAKSPDLKIGGIDSVIGNQGVVDINGIAISIDEPRHKDTRHSPSGPNHQLQQQPKFDI